MSAHFLPQFPAEAQPAAFHAPHSPLAAALKHCPTCSAIFDVRRIDPARVCSTCHRPLTERAGEYACELCGRTYAPLAIRWCPQCGAHLAPDSPRVAFPIARRYELHFADYPTLQIADPDVADGWLTAVAWLWRQVYGAIPRRAYIAAIPPDSRG